MTQNMIQFFLQETWKDFHDSLEKVCIGKPIWLSSQRKHNQYFSDKSLGY